MGQIPSILVRFKIISNCCTVEETEYVEEEITDEKCPTTYNLNLEVS